MHRTPLGLAALILTIAGCGKPAGPAAPGPGPAAPAAGPAAPAPVGQLAGSPSCSNRGCHGDFERPNTKPEDKYQHSYTRWLHHDPHTNAYRSLESKKGREIGEKLGLKVPPSQHPACLACHITPQAAEKTDELSLAERGIGVGCESCHGAASGWLDPHQEKGWGESKKQDAKGMFALSTHAQRAEVCAGCHVGAPEDKARGLPLRDMNHDMIAAGHPRLMFEYASYLGNLPEHWNEKAAMKEGDRRWLVGQLASAKSAMALLADRAGRAATAPWPEFAEHDCYACHHDLHSKSWRQGRDHRNTPAKLGAARANQWYTALLPTIHKALGEQGPSPEGLVGMMARRRPPPGLVQAEAIRLAGLLGEQAVAADVPMTPARRLGRVRAGSAWPGLHLA